MEDCQIALELLMSAPARRSQPQLPQHSQRPKSLSSAATCRGLTFAREHLTNNAPLDLFSRDTDLDDSEGGAGQAHGIVQRIQRHLLPWESLGHTTQAEADDLTPLAGTENWTVEAAGLFLDVPWGVKPEQNAFIGINTFATGLLARQELQLWHGGHYLFQRDYEG